MVDWIPCISKLRNKPELLTKFDNVIQDHFTTKAIAESVDIDSQDGIKHYLPHHAMMNPIKKKTKLIAVYYVSVKPTQKHQSLNDCLYGGPVMLHYLFGLLLRFRLRNVALVADIEKAFLKIG